MSTLEWNGKPTLNREQAQYWVDIEVLKRCEPYVPMEHKNLIRSGIDNTTPGSGQVQYMTPYARRWYFEPARFSGAPFRGNYWFERMLSNGGMEAIRRGLVKKLTGGRFK